jgi:hypothetical protein
MIIVIAGRLSTFGAPSRPAALDQECDAETAIV